MDNDETQLYQEFTVKKKVHRYIALVPYKLKAGIVGIVSQYRRMLLEIPAS
jgi:hypothetical protein